MNKPKLNLMMLGIIVFFTNNKMLSGSKIRQKLAARNNFATVQIVNLPVSQESFLPWRILLYGDILSAGSQTNTS
ncbi:hypothetical protein MY010_47090 [Escherichia coli]|nr:hypothetical protein MS8320_A0230 [Escherichia coli]BBU53094.1 hypothetical protein ECO25NV_47490 [Escherichia coli O25:H4]GMQ44838.1 hypothetical protein CRE1104_47700 [Escherichia coli O102:H6]BCA47873.1 hypothetical protein Esc0902E_48060 [Escherichia coli]BDO72907.1 hypothetical protein TUM2798_45790 [Escherichia coli]